MKHKNNSTKRVTVDLG